ncbi:MAG: Nramp family divalent metal transporter [Verrucomicrobiota bacterium]|nr:Nramp family divalent metal transporter [Verrucomicrobiota bacterium]
MKKYLNSLGPAIIVAAVVLGPGSILTASQTGAEFGYSMTWVLAIAVILMIGACALCARLGAILDGTPCDELARRLGRPVAVAVGIIVFLIAAGFQTSNNLGILKALSPFIDPDSHPWLSKWLPVILVSGLNGALIAIVYRSRSLYTPVERAMKFLVGLMIIAFLANLLVTGPSISQTLKGLVPRLPETGGTRSNLLAVMGLMATTFSIAGAFYQAYLVRDRGWKIDDVRRTFIDCLTGILALGGITLIIMMSAAATLHGKNIPQNVSAVAKQLEGLFGPWAGIVFTVGIVAGALSSFLVNSMVGGRFLADGMGRGKSADAPWSRHGTALALAAGLVGGLIAFLFVDPSERGATAPIIIAQASTMIGAPALALSILYLATRKGIRSPRWMLALCWIGLIVTLVLVWRTGTVLMPKLFG